MNPALKQKVRSREQARAQVVAGLQALSTARDLVATGGDRETMFEAAARLCDSYVLLRFAQQELFVPQDPQAKKFAERKGIPTDNVVHEHLRKSLDHIRKARSWVTQVAERNNASLLGPISEEVASALVLGRQALQRL